MTQALVDFPAGCVTNAMIAAGVAASKSTRHQAVPVELYGPLVTVAALTKWIYIVRGGSGTILGFEAAIAVDATGADRVVNIDLQKSTAGGAFATVLSAPISLVDGTTIRTPYPGVITTAPLLDGDILQVVVTVSGSASAAATGLTVCLNLEEAYAA